jgi:SAM-dependent methyltransferase
MSERSPEYLRANRAAWDGWAGQFTEAGERSWASDEPFWGIFRIPETEVGFLPEVTGRDVLEDGCGTGYVSAWVARRGGRPVGIDNSGGQLATARRLQAEHGLDFPLLKAAAEALPFRDESFDVVVSEYGAAIWSDPYRWIPEARRVLRPGGELAFLGNSTLSMICAPDEDGVPADATLRRPAFGMHRMTWPDDDSVEFHLSHGDWIRLLRGNGFEILDLLELRPPEGATTEYEHVTAEWARRWPAEEAWRARLEG